MKINFPILILILCILNACSKSQNIPKKELPADINNSISDKSDYSIPENLYNVSKYKNGYTADETKFYRQSYSPVSGVTADDVGSYWSSRLSEVNPTTIVHRAGQVSTLSYDTIPEIGNVVAKTLLGTMTLDEAMNDSRSRMKAIAVIHNGQIVFERYLGLKDYDNHLWASATKIFNGTLMHIAEEKGVIDFNLPVTNYLPELKETDWEGIKVIDVLHQRSGLDISESRSVSSEENPVSLLYAIAGGDNSLPEGTSLIEAIKLSEKKVEPGSHFEYASINTHVLTLILESVWNKPIEDLITEQIWSKAGMEGDGVLGLSASGEPMAFGIFASRLRDLARFGMLFTPSWSTITDEQIISDSYFENALKEAKTDIYGKDYMSQRLINDFGESNFGASYQWDAVFKDGDMYKSGRTGQCLYVSPGTNTVVVWYSSSYMAEVWVHAYARAIVNNAFRINN